MLPWRGTGSDFPSVEDGQVQDSFLAFMTTGSAILPDPDVDGWKKAALSY